jgi:hypothetical protein
VTGEATVGLYLLKRFEKFQTLKPSTAYSGDLGVPLLAAGRFVPFDRRRQ